MVRSAEPISRRCCPPVPTSRSCAPLPPRSLGVSLDPRERSVVHKFSIRAVSDSLTSTERLRTSNSIERLNKEIKRRTRVVGLFPNEASLLRLVTALALEVSEDWESGRIYLSMNLI